MFQEPDPLEEALEYLSDSKTEAMKKLNSRGPSKNRNRLEGHDKIYANYFSEDPIYDVDDFERRFRITRSLFDRIRGDIVNYDEYFLQKAVCREDFCISYL